MWLGTEHTCKAFAAGLPRILLISDSKQPALYSVCGIGYIYKAFSTQAGLQATALLVCGIDYIASNLVSCAHFDTISKPLPRYIQAAE